MTLTIPVENHTSRRVQLGKATKIRASSGGTGTFIPEKSGHVPILSFKGGITTNRPHYNCSGGNPQRVYKKGGQHWHFLYTDIMSSCPTTHRMSIGKRTITQLVMRQERISEVFFTYLRRVFIRSGSFFRLISGHRAPIAASNFFPLNNGNAAIP